MFHMPGFLPLTAARPSHIIWSKDQVWSKVSMAWFCWEKILPESIVFHDFHYTPQNKGSCGRPFSMFSSTNSWKVAEMMRLRQNFPGSLIWSIKDRLSSWYSTSLEASASCWPLGSLFDPQSAEMPSATFMPSGNCSCIVLQIWSPTVPTEHPNCTSKNASTTQKKTKSFGVKFTLNFVGYSSPYYSCKGTIFQLLEVLSSQ